MSRRYQVNHGRRQDLSEIERTAVLEAFTVIETSIAFSLIDAHRERDDEIMHRIHRRSARRHAFVTRQMIVAFADCKPFKHKPGCLCLQLARIS